jgi:hypothetical protein
MRHALILALVACRSTPGADVSDRCATDDDCTIVYARQCCPSCASPDSEAVTQARARAREVDEARACDGVICAHDRVDCGRPACEPSYRAACERGACTRQLVTGCGEGSTRRPP